MTIPFLSFSVSSRAPALALIGAPIGAHLLELSVETSGCHAPSTQHESSAGLSREADLSVAGVRRAACQRSACRGWCEPGRTDLGLQVGPGRERGKGALDAHAFAPDRAVGDRAPMLRAPQAQALPCAHNTSGNLPPPVGVQLVHSSGFSPCTTVASAHARSIISVTHASECACCPSSHGTRLSIVHSQRAHRRGACSP